MQFRHYRFVAVLVTIMACHSLVASARAESGSYAGDRHIHEKSVWDVSTALLTADFIEALKAVRHTHDLIESNGATPDIVVLFRSVSTAQVARTERLEQMVAPGLVAELRARLEELADLTGVRLQTDARSRALLREDYQRVVTLIDDVYAALITYQSEGYSLVTIYPSPEGART